MTDRSAEAALAIREFCRDKEIRISLLAKETGISESGLCHKLSGRTRMTLGEYTAICDALGVAYAEFLPEMDEQRRGKWREMVKYRKPRTAEERREAGLCTRCGKPKDDPDKAKCESCRAYDAALRKLNPPKDAIEKRTERRQKNREKGLCACGQPVTPGFATCEKCRLRSRGISAEHYRRKHSAGEQPHKKNKRQHMHNSNMVDMHPDVIAVCMNCTKEKCIGECMELKRKRDEIIQRRKDHG